MNNKQESELIKLIIEFLIDAKHLYDVEKYSLKAYLSEKSTKVPITFQAQNRWLDNLTIDYYQQKILEECGGFNIIEDYIVLGCDIEDSRGIHEIKYYFDQKLTDKLNEEFARY